MVNQLLAILDGVDSLNNILVIGLTNRRELMDGSLLRPGRLEVPLHGPHRAKPPQLHGSRRAICMHMYRPLRPVPSAD